MRLRALELITAGHNCYIYCLYVKRLYANLSLLLFLETEKKTNRTNDSIFQQVDLSFDKHKKVYGGGAYTLPVNSYLSDI